MVHDMSLDVNLPLSLQIHVSKDASLQKAAVETYTINTLLGKDDVSWYMHSWIHENIIAY